MNPDWNGTDVRRLRKAMRTTILAFAARVGVHERTVRRWEKQGVAASIQPATCVRLDQMVDRLHPTVRERFNRAHGAATRPARAGNPSDDDVHLSGPDPLLDPDQPDESFTVTGRKVDDAVRCRRLLPTMTAAFAMVGLPELVGMLLGEHVAPDSTPPPSLAVLRQQVTVAKTLFQACEYDSLARCLPPLLTGLTAAQREATGDCLIDLHTVGAAVYHVVASLLLKNADSSMALLAAQRSTQHAHATGDHMILAASARIMAHALASNGHTFYAVAVAHQAAQRLDRDGLTSPDAASVYGALVLRAAVAAAHLDDRDTAAALLDEGERAAIRLGYDGNHQWTGFGPSNVQLHRVNVAVALGDAGTAIHLAHAIDRSRLQLTERKATLYLDVAQAYTRWGRHAQALSALHTANSIAPQEIRTRPTVRHTVSDLIATAPASVRSEAIQFVAAAKLRL